MLETHTIQQLIDARLHDVDAIITALSLLLVYFSQPKDRETLLTQATQEIRESHQDALTDLPVLITDIITPILSELNIPVHISYHIFPNESIVYGEILQKSNNASQKRACMIFASFSMPSDNGTPQLLIAVFDSHNWYVSTNTGAELESSYRGHMQLNVGNQAISITIELDTLQVVASSMGSATYTCAHDVKPQSGHAYRVYATQDKDS